MKRRRGISTVIGAVFFIIIFTTTISYVTYNMNLLNNFANAIVTKNQADADANHENFIISKATINNNKFNITVQNTGNLALNITRIYVLNKTDPTWGTHKYTVNQIIYPGHSLSQIGQSLPLYAKATQGYDLKLVTTRGNTNEFFVNSASQEPVYMQLYTLPTTGGPNSFNTTLLYSVTNNMTNGGTLSNIVPNMVVTNTTGKAILISGPTPSSYPLLPSGDTAFFQWKYKITGTSGQTVNFKTSLMNGYLSNNISQDITLTNVTSGTNIGKHGTGFYAGVSANTLRFKNVTAGNGITITSNSTDVTFLSNAVGSSGTNIGKGGKGVYAGVAGSVLQFKNVTAGIGIIISSNATDVTVTANGGGTLSSGTNIGHGGKGVYASTVGSTIQFRNITSANVNHLTVTANATDISLDTGSTLTETSEAATAPLAGGSSTVPGASLRWYQFYTMPNTEKFYLITGIEWINKATINGNVQCGVDKVDAIPPVSTSVQLMAFSNTVAQAGANAIQRNSAMVSHPIRGGTMVGAWCESSSATATFGTTGVTSANNRKTIAFTSAVPQQDTTAWTASVTGFSVKLYYVGYK